jgi:splicing factor 3B subunit 2
MERVLKFRDNQHEEARVTKLHSNTGHQTDSGIEQNDNVDDQSDENNDDDDDDDNDNDTVAGTRSEMGLSRKGKKEMQKRRRRRAKKKSKPVKNHSESMPTETSQESSKSDNNNNNKNKQSQSNDDADADDTDPNNDVEIEYVQEDMPIKRGDGYYSHFVKVFENFKLDPTADENAEYHYNKYGKKVPGPKVLLPRDKTNIDDNDDDDEKTKSNTNNDRKKKDDDDDDDDDEQNQKKSKKQLKRETRLSVAQLKQLVNRPDVVEMFDITAKDPKLLVYMKVSQWLYVHARKEIDRS